MRLTTKDAAGIGLVAGTCAALAFHGAAGRHQDSHTSPVADAGGAVTTAVDVRTYAFYDVNVLPMDRDAVLRHQVVLVRDGFVTRIGDVGVVEIPHGARRIDGRGAMFLSPGLTDAHVHLGREAEELMPLFLASGVTTVPNLEGTAQHLELRARVLDREVLGPGRFVREHVDEQASFGTLRVGARADLLLLSDDPRASLDVLRRPEGVMVRGRWLDAGALQRLLPEPVERADPDRD